MEIRTLRYFLAVAREENMTRAAEQLHVTQPTLSKALKALEDELGKKLFTRHSFSIRLTAEGVLLRNHAEDLVSMADKITQEFVTLDDITGGDIYLGMAESYQIRILARAIKEFRQQYSELHYHITSGDTEQVTEKLDKGLLDFAVLAERPDTVKYDYLVFPQADVWGLVFPADDPLAHKEAITVDDLFPYLASRSVKPIKTSKRVSGSSPGPVNVVLCYISVCDRWRFGRGFQSGPVTQADLPQFCPGWIV